MGARRTSLRGMKLMLVACILAQAAASHAQVTTTITSSGLGTTVTPPPAGGTVFQITGGTRPSQGPNLFHSFGHPHVRRA